MTEVTQLIDQRRISGLQLRVLAVCTLAMLFDGYDIQVMALAVPSIAGAWGIKPSSFSWALAASLAGMGLGSGFIAPLGDRLGRKRIMVASLALAGIGAVATAWSNSLTDLALWRFVTGLGIGGVIANATTLTSEYMPQRKRTWLVTVMYVGVPLGAFSAGIAAPALLNHTDWRGLFYFGGAGSLLAALISWAGTPESLKFMLAKRPGDPRIAAILKGLAPEVDPGGVFIEPEIARKRSVLDLLSNEYVARTLLLWLIYVFNIFIIYMLTSWLPTVLTAAGWPRDQVLVGAVLNQIGGVVGGVLLSLIVDKYSPKLSLAAGYAICAVALGLLLVIPSSFANWAALLLLVGFGLSGAQAVLVAIAAAFYPLTIRATGVGVAVTVGRIGAISAPLIGGVIIQRAAPAEAVGLLVIPALVCVAASLLVRKAWMER